MSQVCFIGSSFYFIEFRIFFRKNVEKVTRFLKIK